MSGISQSFYIPKCRFVFSLSVKHVRVLLNKEVQWHLNRDGQRLQQKPGEVFKVFGNFGNVLSEPWQRLSVGGEKINS
jgi:hypothetical protein